MQGKRNAKADLKIAISIAGSSEINIYRRKNY
jgi:hypothetical protein